LYWQSSRLSVVSSPYNKFLISIIVLTCTATAGTDLNRTRSIRNASSFIPGLDDYNSLSVYSSFHQFLQTNVGLESLLRAHSLPNSLSQHHTPIILLGRYVVTNADTFENEAQSRTAVIHVFLSVVLFYFLFLLRTKTMFHNSKSLENEGNTYPRPFRMSTSPHGAAPTRIIIFKSNVVLIILI
jgi:hypothetical protein